MKIKKTNSMKTNFQLVFSFLNLFFIPFLMKPLHGQIAEGQDKFLGNCLGNTIYSSYTNFWNQVTPGNAGKWGSVEYTRNSYYWTPLDNIYNMAQTEGILYKHHTLVWGSQQPGWISSLDSAEQRAEIEEWFRLVGERYPNMDFVDVVNEPFHAPPDDAHEGGYINALGGSGSTGWDWVITAFELARQYMPDSADLILNEYNVLHSNEVTNNYLDLIGLLNDRGLIDGIGIQGHYFEFKGSGYTYSISTIEANLDRLAATGLPVYITEFDINEADDAVQLENYQTYFPIFWEHPGVKGMTLWGYVEGDMWKVDAYLLKYNGRPRSAFNWLSEYISTPRPPQPPEIIYPDDIDLEIQNPIFSWSLVKEATSYHLEISTNSTFSSIVVDTVIVDTFYQSKPLGANKVIYWHISAINENGEGDYSELAAFVTGANITALTADKTGPIEYYLARNYPNPFNPATTIEFSIGKDELVSLQVFDLRGHEVATLINRDMTAGCYRVRFQAEGLNSGVYFYRLEAGAFHQIRKMIFIK